MVSIREKPPTAKLLKASGPLLRLAVGLFLSAITFLCILGMSANKSTPPGTVDEQIVIFLTGNELGAMKPCGCSGGQLGGLDRRKAVFDTVGPQNKLIVDTGSLVENDSEQNRIKFGIIVQSFGVLGYDLINLTDSDIEVATSLGLIEGIAGIFSVISPSAPADAGIPQKFTKKFRLNSETIEVAIAAVSTESITTDKIKTLFAESGDIRQINILILNNCDKKLTDSLARLGLVDCFICPPESDEPEIISDPKKTPLIISMGRLGKYIGKLQIKKGKPALDFSIIAVTENIAQQTEATELYTDYQQFVRQANLLEKYPRFSLPKDLTYLGSNSCRLCHEYEYDKWSEKPHAHAYATLEKVGSQYDPECVICHVVGLEYETGFINEEKTAHLKDVGCENCHGPALQHITSLGKEKTAEPKSKCVDCHTTENSADYAGNEEYYLQQIIHWREPNATADVKDSNESGY